jgi:hypothetical protein
VAEPQEMLPWIRGWGADVEVATPEGLRTALAVETQKLSRLYHVAVTPPDPEVERLLECWGKTKDDSTDYHPALFHMLDVGHVAQALLQPPASLRWRKVLATALNTEPDTLATWLPYFVAMHDAGKL